jgi:hypothetical protein
VTTETLKLLRAVHGAAGRAALMTGLGLKDRKHFRERYLAPAVATGLLELTPPERALGIA